MMRSSYSMLSRKRIWKKDCYAYVPGFYKKDRRSDGYPPDFTGVGKSAYCGKRNGAKYGARPLRRALQTELEDKLAEAILNGEVKRGDCIEAGTVKKRDSLHSERRSFIGVEKSNILYYNGTKVKGMRKTMIYTKHIL